MQHSAQALARKLKEDKPRRGEREQLLGVGMLRLHDNANGSGRERPLHTNLHVSLHICARSKVEGPMSKV